MPTRLELDVNQLKLDLKNFRTIPQKNEKEAIKAMISIKPDRFYAVMQSIIEDGYLLTENVIVLNDGVQNIVKEGNRRVAALKLIHGKYDLAEFNLPTSITDSITRIDKKWKKENSKIPCTVFPLEEKDVVDRIVTLTHGKGEKASRDPWSSVARARHNRDVKGGVENGLDMLEKYLKNGSNLNKQQRDRWGGEYPLTVLDEAIRKCYSRMGYSSGAELVESYPKCAYLTEIENIMLDIGLEQIKFETLRNKLLDFPSNYNILPVRTSSEDQESKNETKDSDLPLSKKNTTTNNATQTSPAKAVAVNDPKHVAILLKKFTPKGPNREKVVALRDEIRKLKISSHPIAFCFLLRSMFEISAKAYCTDHNISLTKSGGKDKSLVEVLRGITAHLTNNNSNSAMVKVFHGSMTELAKSDGILSVTSMNQLVHNPSFSIVPSDISIMFGNIYPLLEAMN